jgi:hypothetical protein
MNPLIYVKNVFAPWPCAKSAALASPHHSIILVGAGEHTPRNSEAQCFGALEIQ